MTCNMSNFFQKNVSSKKTTKINVTATLYIFAFINQNEFYHYKLKQGFSLMIFFRFNVSLTRIRTFVPCCQVLSSTMVDQAFAKKFYTIKFGMQHDRYFLAIFNFCQRLREIVKVQIGDYNPDLNYTTTIQIYNCFICQ